MRLTPRSIRGRVFAAFAMSLAAVVVALVFGGVQLREVGAGLRIINSGYLPLAEVSAQLEAVVSQMDWDHDRQLRESPRPLAGHRASAALYTASIQESVGRGRTVVGGAIAVAGSDDQLALDAVLAALDEIEASSRAYEQAVGTWIDAQGGEDSAQQDRALGQLDQHRQQLSLMSANLSALVEGRIARVGEQTERAQDRALVIGGTLAVLAVGFSGLMVGVVLVTLQPIARLTAQVQRLASGDQVGALDVRSDDEVGVLAREFNAMAAAVAERDRRLKERAAALDQLSLRLRRVLDTIGAGLVVVEGEVAEMANPAARDLWGVAESAPLPPALAALAPGRQVEVPLDERLFNFAVVPFGASGRLIVGEDVTDLIRDRERLSRSERLAVVGQMLAQVTHEVRNPLNAMSLNAEMLAEDLAEGAAPPEAREMLATITGEIRRLEQVTARYLDLSRRRQVELGAVDPLELVQSVAQLEAQGLRREGVGIEVLGASPGTLELDGDALRRALRNIIRNAAEAGATRITIQVGPLRAGGAEVRITDDGPGMDPDQRLRVFEPFFTTKAKGTGLGLAISRQELDDVGGTMAVESPGPQGGSTFVIRMPGRTMDEGSAPA